MIRDADKSALLLSIQFAENILIKVNSEVYVDQTTSSDPEIKKLIAKAIGPVRYSSARNSFLSYALFVSPEEASSDPGISEVVVQSLKINET